MRHIRNSKVDIRTWPLAIFLLALVLTFGTKVPSAEAQQPKTVLRIGFLSTADLSSLSLRLNAFRQGLRELGHAEGDTVAIEYRSAEGHPDRLPLLAAELVRLKVDCIVTAGDSPTRAAKQATNTIPVVMVNASNPIHAGLVTGLARPGGNVTGLASVSVELSGKRLALLKEVVPKLSHAAMVWDPRSPDGSLADTKDAARLLGVNVVSLEVQSLGELESAFRYASKDRVNAAIVGYGGFFVTHQARTVELAAKFRMPTMYPEQEFVRAGGLMAYATSVIDLYRRAAGYVDKILKGAKPGDLPIEQPTKFELVVNLKTARALGLTIPESVRLRADEVIQ